jgi:hypothetical protein
MNDAFSFCSASGHDAAPNDPSRSQTQGANMINKFSISAAIGAASIVGLLAFTPAANAKSVTSCHAANGSSVVSCCEQIVAKKGMPNWMMQGSLSCKEVVKCSMFKSSNERCYVQPRSTENTKGGQSGESGNDSTGAL